MCLWIAVWSCKGYGDVVDVCACQGYVYAVDMCLCRVAVEALTFLSPVLGNLWPEARMRRDGWPCQDLSERLVSARGHSILWSADWWHCSVTCESSRWLCRALSLFCESQCSPERLQKTDKNTACPWLSFWLAAQTVNDEFYSAPALILPQAGSSL